MGRRGWIEGRGCSVVESYSSGYFWSKVTRLWPRWVLSFSILWALSSVQTPHSLASPVSLMLGRWRPVMFWAISSGPESTVSSLVLLTLSSRLLSVQHSARLFISSWYELLSLFVMWPMAVVLSAYFTIVLLMSGCAVVGVQCEQEGGWAHSPGVLRC